MNEGNRNGYNGDTIMRRGDDRTIGGSRSDDRIKEDVSDTLEIDQSVFQRAKEAFFGSQLSEDPNESRVGQKNSKRPAKRAGKRH